MQLGEGRRFKYDAEVHRDLPQPTDSKLLPPSQCLIGLDLQQIPSVARGSRRRLGHFLVSEEERRVVQEFTAARYIRLRLQRIRTLNADLMMAIAEDPRYLDPTVTNRVSITILMS